MDRIAVSTVVYVDRETAFDFLLDFPGYARYSEHLDRVAADGDGGPGTRYRLHFVWWKLSYTAHSEVTGAERPERIDFRITRHVDAEGEWTVTPLADLPADAPPDATEGCRVRFEARFDPDSVQEGAIDLPRLVSLDRVVGMVRPRLVAEAERVVERIVADLEGRERPVDLTVEGIG